MLLADVNVLIAAHRPESEGHVEHKAWLEAAVAGPEPLGVSELVLSALVRIVTNHRVYMDPTPPGAAVDFCDGVLEGPSVVVVRPGPRHWAIFSDLVRAVGARANVVPDAYLAALAIEHGATWITNDRGFARFPGLRWQRPLDQVD